MLVVISWLLFFIGLVVIVAIVIRKFPQLSNIDIENLPQEKEALKKREILLRRIEAERRELHDRWSARLQPIRRWWGDVQFRFRKYVGRMERLWHHEERTKFKTTTPAVAVPEEKEQKINTIIQEAIQYFKEGSYEKAETFFIAAIKLDPKSAAAYRGLADTYFSQGSLVEAEETLLFLHQLEPHDDAVLVKLGDIAEQKGDLEKAIEFYQEAAVMNDLLSPRFYHLAELLLKLKQPSTAREAIVQAVELEPKNPKYLDLLIEIGVLCGDKELAEKGYNELRLLNPKNQKLPGFLERIKSLS